MKYIACLVIILIIIKIFISFKHVQKYYPSKGEQLVNVILAETAKIIEKKYNVIPCGEGAAMPGGPIQELTLCFDTKYPYSQMQLRELLIKSVRELLNQINQNSEIQEFLSERPFTIKNTEIIIYNHDESGRRLFDPNISTARISQATLVYRIVDAEDRFKYKNEIYERYEDAIKEMKEIE